MEQITARSVEMKVKQSPLKTRSCASRGVFSANPEEQHRARSRCGSASHPLCLPSTLLGITARQNITSVQERSGGRRQAEPDGDTDTDTEKEDVRPPPPEECCVRAAAAAARRTRKRHIFQQTRSTFLPPKGKNSVPAPRALPAAHCCLSTVQRVVVRVLSRTHRPTVPTDATFGSAQAPPSPPRDKFGECAALRVRTCLSARAARVRRSFSVHGPVLSGRIAAAALRVCAIITPTHTHARVLCARARTLWRTSAADRCALSCAPLM